jgi:ribonuclease BN (tRNA processing enzyme)
VRLTVLGSQGTWPGAGRECCGYVVTSEGFHLWMDAGTGTFARLQEHVAVGDVGAMLISHGHADLFLCEATYQNDSELSFFHLSAEQAAVHAATAGAKRLVLTHITPNLDPGISLEQASSAFEGAIDVAVPDDVWEVGS